MDSFEAEVTIMKRNVLLICALFTILAGCMASPIPNTERDQHMDSKKETAKTFLLIGVDSRGEEDSRADAVLLARYEPKQGQIKLASIMRDSYVKIPGYEKGYHKINAAYYYGGSELMKKTILENFNINVDHVAVIDFQGFVNIVDLIAPDGLTVDVKPEMISDMSIAASSGENVLHGEQILKYVRFRHDNESDFGRVERQQEVLVQLKDQLIQQLSNVDGIVALPGMIEEALTYVETDIGMKTMFVLSSQAMFHPVDSIKTLRIPVNDSYTNEMYPHAGAVLSIDFEKNQQALQEFFE